MTTHVRAPQEPAEGFVAVGRVLRPWGLRGDMKVESLTDFPERFGVGAGLWVQGLERRVEASRWSKGALVLKLRGVDDLGAVDALRGELLQVRERDVRPLEPGAYYDYHLLGLRVVDEAAVMLGLVVEVLHTGANAALVVRGEQGDLLLPFIEEVVKDIQLDTKLMRVQLMDGLEFNRARVATVRPPARRRRAIDRQRTSR